MAKEKEVNNQGINEQIKLFRKKLKELDDVKVNIAIVGSPGVGKSSLINAMANSQVSKVSGIHACTGIDPKTFEKVKDFTPCYFDFGNVIIHDLPGFGDTKFSADEYFNEFNLKNFDCVLLCTERNVYEHDKLVFKKILKSKIPFFLIRTKFDLVIADEKKNARRSAEVPKNEKELRKTISNYIHTSLENNDAPAFFVSTEDEFVNKFDLPKLREAIQGSLPKLKRGRLVEWLSIQTEEDLKKKREEAETQMKYRAVAAAANGGFTPPGFDVAVDIGILYELSQKISKIYGLTESQLKSKQSIFTTELKMKVANRLVAYLTMDGIKTFLLKIAGRVAFKSLSKWIPLIGQLLAAGIGYKLTISFGEELIDECEALASEILRSELKINNENAA